MPIRARATVSVRCSKKVRAGLRRRLTARDGNSAYTRLGMLYNRGEGHNRTKGRCRPPRPALVSRDMSVFPRMRARPARYLQGLLGTLASLTIASAPAGASLYPLPTDGSAVVGSDSTITTVYEDTLPDLAPRYSLGYYEIIRANPGVAVWLPGSGKRITLPGRHILPAGPREGIVVNLPEHRLYYFPKPGPNEKQ